jgi:hypothetical protein
VVFSCREPLLLTVYSPAGRGEDNLAHPILDASLEEADCSQDGLEVSELAQWCSRQSAS